MLLFLAFASAYFMSAALRTVTATLAPVLTQDFALEARDLGLLSGAYFLGFASLQLPLGAWLDKWGPKRVLLLLLLVAIAGCLAFAQAADFKSLLLARLLCGVGVCACLMAPLTAYRRWYDAKLQLRANSWMLMMGSLGMLIATLPVQYAFERMGWRPVFVLCAMLIAVSCLLVLCWVPRWQKVAEELNKPTNETVEIASALVTQRSIWLHPMFRRMVPIGFTCYGGLMALQTLWVGPWMTQVAGYSGSQAAQGLFAINAIMLVTFLLWGWLNPKLAAKGWSVVRLLKLGLPLVLLALLICLVFATRESVIPVWLLWALYFVASSVIALTQPAVAQAFPAAMAGRALTAYNLVLFAGVFAVQWGIGLAIDAFKWAGWDTVSAYRGAFALFGMLCAVAYLHFLSVSSDNQSLND